MGKYVDEKNTLMLMALMKAHGVRKVIASPGATNIGVVASFQADSWFEVYSAVDERSAAYIACGMAAESGEPVALSCTQATASRNYYPGLTEAFYRKLPVLAITSTQHAVRIGQNIQQAIDRTVQPVDLVKLSVQIPIIQSDDDEHYANIQLNKALLELTHNGGGPVHINLTTDYSKGFNVDKLPETRVIRRFSYLDKLPDIKQNSRIVVFVGTHKKWSNTLTSAVDEFCEKYGAIVLCDQTSNYRGKYGIEHGLLVAQTNYVSSVLKSDLVIHIGDTSGAAHPAKTGEVWRVNPDGEIRDTMRKLTNVFEMEEEYFFRMYNERENYQSLGNSYQKQWSSEMAKIFDNLPGFPFSNLWIAQQTLPKLPEGSILQMGIYNSLRMWGLFSAPKSVLGYANTGGFGIDGAISATLGASLASPEKLHFLVLGDLAFFYDMNTLGSRHIGKNLRILLINNGLGQEFKNPDNRASVSGLGEKTNPFISAEGHFGAKSDRLVRDYATDLGFKYLSAKNKKEYLKQLDQFTDSEIKKPMLFEVFVDSRDETKAYEMMREIEQSSAGRAKNVVKNLVGEKNLQKIKKVIKR